MLFYLVTGELPFTGSNPSLILKNVIEGNRPNVSELAPDIAPTLADVIERLMATSPEGRFNTASEVAESLVTVLDDASIRPDDRAWSVEAFLADPDTYTERLETHVQRTVLARGKASLEDGDALSALRLFNRLLAMDEGNEEVLELVASLHHEPESRRRPVTFGLGLAAFVLVAGVLVTWFAGPLAVSSRPDETPSDASPDIASPSDDRPSEPEPLASPEPEPATPTPAVASPEPEAPTEPVARVDTPRPAPRPVPRPPRPEPVAVAEDARPMPNRIDLQPTLQIVPNRPGTLRVVSNMAADIYQGDRRLGSTRSALQLEPGAHVLEIRSDVVKPFELRVEVAPGESVERIVQLEARPATVRFASVFSDACDVTLDGVRVGTLGSLGRELSVPRPQQHGHAVKLQCPDSPPWDHVWSSVVIPDQVLQP
jgi:hypothetical protein